MVYLTVVSSDAAVKSAVWKIFMNLKIFMTLNKMMVVGVFEVAQSEYDISNGLSDSCQLSYLCQIRSFDNFS